MRPLGTLALADPLAARLVREGCAMSDFSRHPAHRAGASVDLSRCSIPPPVTSREAQTYRAGWEEGYEDAVNDLRNGSLNLAALGETGPDK